MAVDPLFKLEVEFTAGSFTNITSDCLRFAVSRRIASFDRGIQTGQAQFLMRNENGKYTPGNSAGPFFGSMKPNKQLKLTATHLTSFYAVFAGFVDSYTLNPNREEETCLLVSSDRIKQLSQREINLPISIDTNVGSLFDDILSRAGIAPVDRQIDTMTDQIAVVFQERRKASSLLDDLLVFGNFKAFVDTDGKFNVKNRHFNASGTVVSSYNSFFDLDVQLDEDLISNTIRVTGRPRKQSTAVQTIAWLNEVPIIAPSGATSFWLEYLDPDTLESNTPANSVVPLVPSSDYLSNTAADGSGTDRTSLMSANTTFFATTALCSLFNGSSDSVFITKFQIRGHSLQIQPKISVEQEDVTSQADYGKRDFSLDSDFIDNTLYAQDYAAFLKAERSEPVEGVNFSIKNEWPDQFTNSLGNLIHLNNSLSGIGSLFWVRGIEHEVSLERGLEHVTNYDVEFFRDRGWKIFDDAIKGQLDNARLGF